MDCGQNLRDLLAPLGVYRWEGTFQWGELRSEGAALDQVARELESLQRETSLVSAGDQGLKELARLLPWYIGGGSGETLRQALTALLRVGDDSLTLAAINDTLRCCGTGAVAEETGDPLRLRVRFSGSQGVPEDFQRLRAVIQGILPCHLQAEYQFQVLAWAALEAAFSTWEKLESGVCAWGSLEP